MSGTEFKGRGVLITRVLAQSQGLKQAVELQGGRAYLFPALEIELTPAGQLQAVLGKADIGDILIFVSINAVAGVFNEISPVLRQRLSEFRIGAVGVRTCQSLQSEGLDVVIQPAADQQNSEGLLQHSALQALNGQRIWIVRGQSGRDLLRDQLQNRGAEVRYIQAYQRSVPANYDVKPVLIALESGQIQIVMLTSYGMFSNLLQMLGEQAIPLLQSTRLIVPGQRVAKKIHSEYDFNIGVADNASDPAMLACAAKEKLGSE